MPDLTHALGAAADAATAHLTPIPVAPVVARIRRRRTVQYASQGAIGIAAAGGLVVAGVQLANRPPTPPATTGPSPTPTSLAEAVAVRCGADLDEYAQPEGAPVLGPFVAVPDGTAVADRPVPIWMYASAGADDARRLGSRATYALVLGGQVVALPAEGWVDEGLGWDGGPTLNRWPEVPFAACRPDGTLGDPPAPGTYGLVAFLVPEDGADWVVPMASDMSLVTLAEPTDEPAAPALDSMVLTWDGLGDGPTALRLGDPLVSGEPGALVAWEEDTCLVVAQPGGDRIEDSWVSTLRDGTDVFGRRATGFAALVDGDGLVRGLEVLAEGPHTEAGIQVGSSLDDVRAAYPGVTMIGQSPASGAIPAQEVWAVTQGDRMLTFHVYDGAPLATGWFPVAADTVASIGLQLGTSVDDATVLRLC